MAFAWFRTKVLQRCVCGHSHFFHLPYLRSRSHLPKICQKSGRADIDTIRDVPRLVVTSIAKRRETMLSARVPHHDTLGSLHPNKDEPDLCKKAHPDAQEVTESFFDLHRHDDQGGSPRLASALGSCSSAAKSCSPMAPAAKAPRRDWSLRKASPQRFVKFRKA